MRSPEMPAPAHGYYTSRRYGPLVADPFDLGSLDPQARHQSLLIEIECVNAAVQGLAANRAGRAFIDEDHARGGADRPSSGRVYSSDCPLVHEEKRVAVSLNTGL